MSAGTSVAVAETSSAGFSVLRTIAAQRSSSRGCWLLLVFAVVVGWVSLFVFTVLEGDQPPNAYSANPKAGV